MQKRLIVISFLLVLGFSAHAVSDLGADEIPSRKYDELEQAVSECTKELLKEFCMAVVPSEVGSLCTESGRARYVYQGDKEFQDSVRFDFEGRLTLSNGGAYEFRFGFENEHFVLRGSRDFDNFQGTKNRAFRLVLPGNQIPYVEYLKSNWASGHDDFGFEDRDLGKAWDPRIVHPILPESVDSVGSNENLLTFWNSAPGGSKFKKKDFDVSRALSCLKEKLNLPVTQVHLN